MGYVLGKSRANSARYGQSCKDGIGILGKAELTSLLTELEGGAESTDGKVSRVMHFVDADK